VADGSYTNLYMPGERKFYSSRSLKQFVAELPSCIFYLFHNGHLININHIEKIKKSHVGTVVMTDGRELEIALSRKEAFLAAIKSKGL